FNNTAIEADRANPKVPGSIRFLGPTMPLRHAASEAEREQLTGQIRELDRKLRARPPAPEAKLLRQKRSQAERALRTRTPSTLVMQELLQPRMTTVFGRGDFRAPGAAV